MQGYMYKIDQ